MLFPVYNIIRRNYNRVNNNRGISGPERARRYLQAVTIDPHDYHPETIHKDNNAMADKRKFFLLSEYRLIDLETLIAWLVLAI